MTFSAYDSRPMSMVGAWDYLKKGYRTMSPHETLGKCSNVFTNELILNNNNHLHISNVVWGWATDSLVNETHLHPVFLWLPLLLL